MSYPIEPMPAAGDPAKAPQPAAATPTTPPGWYQDGTSPNLRWWDGTKWADQYAPPPQPVVLQQKKQTNHIFHLLMSIITLGLWIPVWIIVAITNA